MERLKYKEDMQKKAAVVIASLIRYIYCYKKHGIIDMKNLTRAKLGIFEFKISSR